MSNDREPKLLTAEDLVNSVGVEPDTERALQVWDRDHASEIAGISLDIHNLDDEFRRTRDHKVNAAAVLSVKALYEAKDDRDNPPSS